MLKVDTIRDVRIAHFVERKGIREISRDLNLSRNTVRTIIRSGIVDQSYCRIDKHRPKLGAVIERLVELLNEDETKPVKQRRRAQILFEQLQREGYAGGYDAVRRYVGAWRREKGKAPAKAFIPLEYDPGDAFQFDWSYEQVELGGMPAEVKIAQFRLCHSRKLFCIAYTRETLEMVLDAHSRAFEFFGGVCRRGIYDNLKTVVTKVLMGKDRVFNRRFQNLASYYLFDPVACTPAAGWEKGQVENQVGVVRHRFFATRRRFADLEELNEWLAGECRNRAATAKHPELKDRTIDQVFAEERTHLLALPVSPFDGYQGNTTRVSSQLLISFDRNRYSVNAMAVGKSVEVRAYADRIIVVMNGTVVGIHRRHLGRDKVIYDPWHYLAVLEQKPGALRNGAPFKEWNLPEAMKEVRTFLEARSDGDRQFVSILSVVKRYGIEDVADACAKALSDKTISSDVILSILSRQHDEPQPAQVTLSAQLPLLTMIPVVDCYRYDRLLSGGAYGTA
ncbi:IS21 family transposase [Geomobilimonas luticola]|uniref:IS21 family transposase n=1 Tax=Geomobilimonas luticola TaxID=1114878 RepID=A0ABS5SAZ9_9BACT|nr:IS21 family transposase [Geomobilimonas luticola]MBT0652543.1 IS21 family transposase [Geomobilimonas luticola]